MTNGIRKTEFPGFLAHDALDVAPLLLGCILERELEGQIIRLRIVETEAYDQSDAASHSYRGQTPRTDVMFGPSGHLYVYFTYGMHYCMNVVTGRAGDGSAVLIRALEPLDGLDLLRARRDRAVHELTNGPAKVCQALGIDRTLNGHDLREPPLRLLQGSADTVDIMVGERIGITKARDALRRFYIRDNPFVSRHKPLVKEPLS